MEIRLERQRGKGTATASANCNRTQARRGRRRPNPGVDHVTTDAFARRLKRGAKNRVLLNPFKNGLRAVFFCLLLGGEKTDVYFLASVVR